MDANKRVGKRRLRELVVVQPNGESYVLGRSTRQTEVLPWDTRHGASGPNIDLLTDPQFEGVRKVCSSIRIRANDNMVIITKHQKSRHDKLLDALQHLNCRRVINYLVYTFDSVEDVIIFAGVVTSVSRLLQECDGLADSPAKNVYVKFWGGPPTRQAFFYGTLLMVLCDKILTTTTDGNFAIYNRFLALKENEEELFSTS
jgi:hypothetical protein